jgi:hypothetical protein
MGSHSAAARIADPYIHIGGYGRLSLAPDTDAPLLVVFGGIDVGGVHSGVYMWNYMNALKSRYHIFVANSNHVNGLASYQALTDKLDKHGVQPREQILYLFSGGYKPGMDLLRFKPASIFSWIYLVDIWMGHPTISDFYKNLVTCNAGKMTYVYTVFGANNDKARDFIAAKLGGNATLVKGHAKEGGMQTHMRTNTTALIDL